ncbi:NADH-quinone oxidoreductase subunit L [Arcobacter sp. CECT 8985]|uniref:NADH-quinone oxidoreductase subunit L n=1 Tax=Arcobacter sp. CECT 8985 TaxID=1935424 RepID=UPI00100BDD8F|nr:NADH-quinone oxidoreductase subunit L [Arcobacter sp. CECT 8985]RXJ86204.1 NADH-quinone oxidoreductase subunit L [Arcobacter sp. CECT 8985]
MEKYLYIALFAPLVGSIFAALFSMSKKNIITGVVTSLMLFISMIASLNLLYYIYTTDSIVHVRMLDWIKVGNIDIPFGFVVDHISIVMMSVVTIVSTMVHIHSIGYMDHDKGFNRYFSYLSGFVFSMMILVMSDNFAGLFIGWEGVGLCSWLLIGFWYHKNSAAWAANEAFIMNRIADLGMLVGIFFIYWNIGSLQYEIVFANIDSLPMSLIVTIAIFLFIGAMGKSAQFPFHTWLADAMEGPTPVSALIHAATMVTAGVYLLVRTNEIYTTVPQVGYVIACLGAFVAIFAASMALVNNDMKKIIAYSTLSQLGYMFVAAGLGAYWVALFHLATHAFFKSVLFLGAGNVMHAMNNELDIRKMGGLYKKMKATAIIMIIASIALSGIFPFAGFFSKDKILEVAFDQNAIFLWGILLITAGLTSFYSFRLIMRVFFMKPTYEEYGYHPHETYPFVIAAMIPLGILASIAGWFEHYFVRLVTYLLPNWESTTIVHSTEYILIALTSLVAIGGILLAVYKYNKGGFSKSWEETFSYKVLTNQYFIPLFYDKVICKAYFLISKFAFKVVDVKIIDAIVDFIAKFIYKTGENSVVIQSSNLSQSLKIMTAGVLFILILIASLAIFK